MRIILASASPRRKMLLEQIGIQAEVIPSNGEETIRETDPYKAVEALSREKAVSVGERIHIQDQREKTVIIGADTVVAFGNTILFVIIIVPFQMGLAFGLALFIDKISYCKTYFKISFFIPGVMSLAVVSTLWMQIYNAEGILNTLLGWIGIDPQPFIYSAKQALPSIAFMSIWQGAGYQMLIFLGGLQAISHSLYEAAEIDNASAWAKFRYITLPALKPILIFVFITITIGAFKMVVQPMVMTGGGPSYSTYTLVYDIYQTGTVNWEIGTASAMSIVFAIFVIILTIIQNKITKDKEE